MTPYFMQLTSEESSELYTVLREALKLSKESGTDEQTTRFAEILETVGNRPLSGGFESSAERNAAFLKDFSDHQSIHGAD